jgi:hypothetical protein
VILRALAVRMAIGVSWYALLAATFLVLDLYT